MKTLYSRLRLVNKIPQSDLLVIIVVSSVTVAVDLAIAVLVGIIISAMVFAWEHGKMIQADKKKRKDGHFIICLAFF